jgi:hypothetical protein
MHCIVLYTRSVEQFHDSKDWKKVTLANYDILRKGYRLFCQINMWKLCMFDTCKEIYNHNDRAQLVAKLHNLNHT